MKPILTLEKLQQFKPNADQLRHVENVLIYTALVDTIKPAVEQLQDTILKKHVFTDGETGERILKHSSTYLMAGSDFKRYYALLYAGYLKAGFNVPYDYCPLLIAQSELIKHKRLLVDSMSSLTGVSWKDITKLKHYDQITDLNISFLIKFVDKKSLKLDTNINNYLKTR